MIRPVLAALTACLLAGCADTQTAAGPPPVPALPGGGPGATFTVEGMWSASSSSADPSTVHCSVRAEDGVREYEYTTYRQPQVSADELSGVFINYREVDGGAPEVGLAVLFPDDKGVPVQLSGPYGDSVRVQLSEDQNRIAFSLTSAPAGQQVRGIVTTAVGSITCPQN